MLTITNRKRYEVDKQAQYEALHGYLDAENFKMPDFRVAEFVFVKAKVNCLLGNFEAASEVLLEAFE